MIPASRKKALQTYGMFLADGGNIYISATTSASDQIGGSDLGQLTPNDFETIDGWLPFRLEQPEL